MAIAALKAAAAAGGVALLATTVLDGPTELDRAVRGLVQRPRIRPVQRAMWPLFPIGLPGGFIPIAYATAHWLRRRRRGGGPAIVTAAWCGWLAHRGAKLVYRRERPRRPGTRVRDDSFPSGHTTGITTLAVVMAHVLERERVVSPATARIIRYGAPALMGAYRVIADDHWATDVLGGWLLGAATGELMIAVTESPLLVR